MMLAMTMEFDEEESTNKYKYSAGLDGQNTLYQIRAMCNQERIFPENIPVNKYLGKEDLKLQSSQVYRKLRFFVGCCPHFFSCNKNVFLMNKNKIKRR
jgi:hypothetical protein